MWSILEQELYRQQFEFEHAGSGVVEPQLRYQLRLSNTSEAPRHGRQAPVSSGRRARRRPRAITYD